MKVLQMNCVYGEGSTGRITKEIHNALLHDGINSTVLYGRGKNTSEKNVYRACSNFYAKCNRFISSVTGIPYGGCVLSTNKIIKIIRKEKPDVVHIQCINGYFVNIYKLISWLKSSGIPTVITLHAEFMYTANCGHAFACDGWKSGCKDCQIPKEATKSWFFNRTTESFDKMRRAFDGFGNLKIVSVSPWLRERAEQSLILRGKAHETVLNGVNTNVFRYIDSKEALKRHNIQGKKVILHVTAMFRDKENDIKGGKYIIEVAEKMQNESVVFIVAGKYKLQHKVPENIILLGNINENLLAEYYSVADITVLTSKRETYSMVCAESLCCGTPIVGFCAGAPEMISIPEYSAFVPYGNVDELCSKIHGMIDNGFSKKEISFTASKIYSETTMIKEYKDIYRRMLCDK